MAEAPAVSVVVALRDEATLVAELVERLRRVLQREGESFEIIAVDDGSEDGTIDELRRLATHGDDLRIIELAGNQGQVTALACGMFATRGAIVVTMDGDLQDPPEEIPKLLRALETQHSITSGSRSSRHETLPRWLASRSIHYLACWCTGHHLRDFGGNFRAYRREVVEALRQSWVGETPLLPLALRLGFDVREVGVQRHTRAAGTTRYDLGSLMRIVHRLLATFPGALLRLALLPILVLAWCGLESRAAATAAVILLLVACSYEALAWRSRRQRAARPPFRTRA